FLHDRLGRSRIASYDGRSTLATWLRAVVTNRAINERERRFNNLDCLENVSEPADRSYATRFEAAMRATRYGAMIRDSFQIASRELSERESLILILRYDDMLQAVDIASFLGVHPSTITRSLQQTHKKLRRAVETILHTKYGLGQAAIEECFEHIVETPGHSILAYVKTGCPSYTRIATLSLAHHRL
ncbi:MAG TPA: sigma-70 family RNA polymerase sigma factor, partial [Blastocatellia bacterium]|nr:sigma-70 family RNA polymerase sigma factor [Blastocatellia bacterium]